jgi:N-methylhydantoinase A
MPRRVRGDGQPTQHHAGSEKEMIRVGVDVGGTFTDLLLVDVQSGHSYLLKVPSTQWSVDSIVAGLRNMEESTGIDPSDIVYFSHGSTLAVNTLVQRSGARVGVLTTAGFRDILELRRLRLSKANDFFVPKPVSLVPRRHVKEINERILANGQVYVPIQRTDVEQKAGELVEDGIEAIAICFLHSYRDPSHERLAKTWLEETYPALYTCTSSELWPQQREYERTLVSVINAYVGKRMRDYVSALEDEVKRLGVGCRVFAAKSNGGVMNAPSAAERPIDTLLSGPAMGVIGAAYIGELVGDQQLVTLDMGGTSVDISIVQNHISYSTENTVGDFPIIVPAVNVVSIGAGGGSVAWTDAEGVLKVGPQSAGATPGPACYGRGGRSATVTDAYVATGLIDPENFLGGQMRLDRALAEEALRTLGRRLGTGIQATADAILRVASSNVYAALMPQLARAGADPRSFSILAYGGAGPTHIFMLARSLNFRRVIIPPNPGVLCALGCLAADVRADFVRSIWRDCSQIPDPELQEIYHRLDEEARMWLEAEDVRVERVYVVRTADMCYTGQSFELNVPFPASGYDSLRTEDIVRWFHERYRQVYGYADPSVSVRLLEARVQIIGVTQKPPVGLVTAGAQPSAGRATKRLIYDEGTPLEATVHQRTALHEGDELRGPAIVEQYDTTTYIPPGFRATIDRWSNLIGERM